MIYLPLGLGDLKSLGYSLDRRGFGTPVGVGPPSVTAETPTTIHHPTHHHNMKHASMTHLHHSDNHSDFRSQAYLQNITNTSTQHSNSNNNRNTILNTSNNPSNGTSDTSSNNNSNSIYVNTILGGSGCASSHDFSCDSVVGHTPSNCVSLDSSCSSASAMLVSRPQSHQSHKSSSDGNNSQNSSISPQSCLPPHSTTNNYANFSPSTSNRVYSASNLQQPNLCNVYSGSQSQNSSQPASLCNVYSGGQSQNSPQPASLCNVYSGSQSQNSPQPSNLCNTYSGSQSLSSPQPASLCNGHSSAARNALSHEPLKNLPRFDSLKNLTTSSDPLNHGIMPTSTTSSALHQHHFHHLHHHHHRMGGSVSNLSRIGNGPAVGSNMTLDRSASVTGACENHTQRG